MFLNVFCGGMKGILSIHRSVGETAILGLLLASMNSPCRVIPFAISPCIRKIIGRIFDKQVNAVARLEINGDQWRSMEINDIILSHLFIQASIGQVEGCIEKLQSFRSNSIPSTNMLICSWRLVDCCRSPLIVPIFSNMPQQGSRQKSIYEVCLGLHSLGKNNSINSQSALMPVLSAHPSQWCSMMTK